jgi:mannose-1-phosphate guanylyltransferase
LYIDLVNEQLDGIAANNILAEPSRKNTAPCVAYACYKIAGINPDAVTVIAPSDHLITKEDAFRKTITDCYAKAASDDCLLTLGIIPSRPDTGYGYIQFEDLDIDTGSKAIKKVKTFTEKPDLEMAKFFIENGDFVWNSGIFIWSVKSVIKAFEIHSPEINSLFKEGLGKYNTSDEKAFIADVYVKSKSISIDYAIMEKAKNVFVYSADIGWSDLGTFGSLYEHIDHDKNKNAIVGDNVMIYDSKDCIVNVPKDKLVVMQGLEGYIVVESKDMLLICKKEEEQQLKSFVNDVRVTKGEDFV